MARSEEAKLKAFQKYIQLNPFMTGADHKDALDAALDAAAAVDGDAGWNAALEHAAGALEKVSDYNAASIVRSLMRG